MKNRLCMNSIEIKQNNLLRLGLVLFRCEACGGLGQKAGQRRVNFEMILFSTKSLAF